MKTKFGGIRTILAGVCIAAVLAVPALSQGVSNFTVDPDNDRIWGDNWPSGAVVSVTIGSAPSQFIGTASVDEWGSWGLWDVEYDIQPGLLVTVDDGATSIQHTVKFLAVSEVDVENDTVSGTAEPGSWVQVVAVDMGTYQNMIRNVQVDGSGNWIAGFSFSVGENPEDATYDIQYESSGWVVQADTTPPPHGATYDEWRVPKPYFHVEALNNSVWGGDWPTGSVVTVTMGDSPPLLVGTAPVDAWGNWSLWDGEVDIQAGSLISVSNGNLVVSHWVTSLAVAQVNPSSDVVSGSAEPGSSVQVVVYDYQQVFRNVQADENGDWSADFSVAVGEDPWDAAYDITWGSQGWASQGEGAPVPYGATYVQWSVPKPYFRVDPTQDSLRGRDWPPEDQVTVSVGNPVTFSMTVATDVWGGWEVWNIGFDIQSGDDVTVSNDVAVIIHTVTPLTVTEVDAAADRVSGTAEPGRWVQVEINSEQWIKRNVQADEAGYWTADFSVAGGEEFWEVAYDLETGMDGSATQEDDTAEPYGSTCINWRAVDPFFHMNPRSGAIWGRDWPASGTVTILVGAPESPDYTATLEADGGGGWWLEDDENPVVLALGSSVQVSCGANVKTGIVEFVQVLEVDGDADTVRGLAAPGCWVWVGIDNAGIGREVQADGTGNWMADFSVVAGEEPVDESFDISAGTQGVALIQDEDGDGTLAPWRCSNEPLDVYFGWIEGGFEDDGLASSFEFGVELRGNGILSARVRTPLNDWHDLTVDDWWGEEWALYVHEATFEALDTAFPAGEYLLEIVSCDGTSTNSVTIPPSLEHPNEMPVIVLPTTNVSWPEAYMQWNAPTNANFSTTVIEIEDEFEEFEDEWFFDDVSVSQLLVSGLESDKNYLLSVGFANIVQVETNGIPFVIVRARFVESEFTTGGTSDPTLTNRVSWYGAKGVERGPGESWEFLEGRDRFGKGMTLMQEYVADTDPLDPGSVFKIVSVNPGPPIAVQVVPSSSARVYTLQRRASLTEGEWEDVPGQVEVSGGGEPLGDNPGSGASFFYRVQVEVP